MKRFSKVSFDDIKTIQVDSGVLLKEFDVENPVFLPENVICATNGGINPVCAPEYYDFGEDVDNAKSAKETKRIRGWNVSISFTTFTTSLDLIRFALGTADVSGKMLNIRQKLQYAKDFKDIWWVGKRADDKLIAIRLIRSLSDSGFSLQTTKKGKGQISVTLKGHSSFAEKDKIPMEVYVFAESDIPVTPDAPATALYLYGTPSESGNIGLRSGDSVSYYDGAVLPNIDGDYTDELKVKYPHLVMKFVAERTALGVVHPAYYQLIAAIPLVMDDGDYVRAPDDKLVNFAFTPCVEWRCEAPHNTWVSYGEGGRADLPSIEDIIWTNNDIYYIDDHSDVSKAGTLAVAKSPEPIPVYAGIVDFVGDIPVYE